MVRDGPGHCGSKGEAKRRRDVMRFAGTEDSTVGLRWRARLRKQRDRLRAAVISMRLAGVRKVFNTWAEAAAGEAAEARAKLRGCDVDAFCWCERRSTVGLRTASETAEAKMKLHAAAMSMRFVGARKVFQPGCDGDEIAEAKLHAAAMSMRFAGARKAFNHWSDMAQDTAGKGEAVAAALSMPFAGAGKAFNAWSETAREMPAKAKLRAVAMSMRNTGAKKAINQWSWHGE